MIRLYLFVGVVVFFCFVFVFFNFHIKLIEFVAKEFFVIFSTTGYGRFYGLDDERKV